MDVTSQPTENGLTVTYTTSPLAISMDGGKTWVAQRFRHSVRHEWALWGATWVNLGEIRMDEVGFVKVEPPIPHDADKPKGWLSRLRAGLDAISGKGG